MTKLPFLERFWWPIWKGEKTMTCRTRKYGEPGDILEGPGNCLLRLKAVTRIQLGDVLQHYRKEGCKSPEEFIDIWNQIHPKKGYHPDDWVWLHEFELIE